MCLTFGITDNSSGIRSSGSTFMAEEETVLMFFLSIIALDKLFKKLVVIISNEPNFTGGVSQFYIYSTIYLQFSLKKIEVEEQLDVLTN